MTAVEGNLPRPSPMQGDWWRVAARPGFLTGGFSILAIISAASVLFIVMSRSDNEWLSHTLQVQTKLANLRVALRAGESATRGYQLTGDASYVAGFEYVVGAIMNSLDEVTEATRDNPAQRQRALEIAPLVVARSRELEEIVRLQNAGQSAEALALTRAGNGRAVMEQIRHGILAMIAEENRLLAARSASAARSNRLLLTANLAGVALMIALAILSILTVRRIGAEALRDSESRGEALQAAVEELDAFSYSVSHDLRTPLRAIDGFSRILLKHHAKDLPAEARDHLQSVRDNTVQMGTLVDDLLAFARLNRKEITRREVETKPIVEALVGEAKQRAEGRSVTVSVGELPTVWGDPALLKQVFINLIDNAFKYTRLRKDAAVEIGSTEIDGEQIIFVRDNGVGFDMNFTANLFGVFQRLHRAEDFEGTGVGLAIVRRIVNRHGGRVWAESAVNKGAAFFFTMGTPHNA